MENKWLQEKENLERLINIEKISYEEIGRRYGCSGANIKKMAKKLGIKLLLKRKINPNEHFNKGRKFKIVEEKPKRYCLNCEKELVGKQLKFCCTKCKLEYYKKERKGVSYNSEYSQKKDAHGICLKYKLVKARGGKCEICGYNKNISALHFHHINPETKAFELNSRTLERKPDEEIIEEFKKCKLVCANCHQELHHPEMNMNNLEKFKDLSKNIKHRKIHELELLEVGE